MACGKEGTLWQRRLHQTGVCALYLHIPFCRRKCAYCDFASRAVCDSDPLLNEYLAGLRRLLTEAEQAGFFATCRTAYVGGGTPTLLGARLQSLVAELRYAAPGLEELTCEANPDSLDDEVIDGLAAAGCTRLSIGVQSLDDGELTALGRLHTAEQALDRMRSAVERGVFSVSCDLMCALPGQTDESWQRTLERAVSCGVDHVSVYPLQIEDGTPLAQRIGDAVTPWNDSEVQAHHMEVARRLLEAAGLARYEVASYARAGRECRHNCAYWTAEPYLGLGTAASSMLTREGYECLRTLAPQLPAPKEDASRVRLTCASDTREVASAEGLRNLHFDLEFLNEAQAAAEDLMLSMRMVRGADEGLVEHARCALGARRVDDALAWCAERELVRRADTRWTPTESGWLLGNELYGRLWDLAPSEVATISI